MLNTTIYAGALKTKPELVICKCCSCFAIKVCDEECNVLAHKVELILFLHLSYFWVLITTLPKSFILWSLGAEISSLQESKLFLEVVKILSTCLYDGFTLLPVGLSHNSFWTRSYFLSDFFLQCCWMVQDWQPWSLTHSVLPQNRGQVGAVAGSCSTRKLLKCKCLIWWVCLPVHAVLLISPD